jgi:hydrogenase maturation protease
MTAVRHIICFGNALHGDDGFGPYVYERLRQLAWPQDVLLFDAGTAGLDALAWLEGCCQAILVDALAGRGRPGAVHLFRPALGGQLETDWSGHAGGVPYLLQAAAAVYPSLPDIVVIGAEAASIAPYSPGLSPALRRAVPRVVRVIRHRLIGEAP